MTEKVPVTTYEVTPQWQNFIDLKEDLEPWLQFSGLTISNTETAMLESVLTLSCTWVQEYLGRPVAPTSFKRLFSGWSGLNGSYLSLPYYPVLEITEIVEYWGSSGPHVLNEQTPENQGEAEVYQLDPLRGLVIRAFQGLVQRPFFPGSRNIKVEWVAGYNPVPETIKTAAKEYAAWWWKNTQQASRGPRQMGEYDVALPQQNMWGGVPSHIPALLSPFLQVGIG